MPLYGSYGSHKSGRYCWRGKVVSEWLRDCGREALPTRRCPPNNKVIVERYDDPKVANVSCYKGGLGLAENPSRFSIACRAVGPIAVPTGLPKSEVIAFASASLFFKTFQIHRAIDADKNVLVYTVVSTKLINGSPFNSISVVPAEVR